MIDPLFWLGLSILLVAISLTAVLVVAVPALQELSRAARSAEKLFDTLRRDLPPTLEAIRLTGLEISDLTDDVSDGVKSANQVVKQVDQTLDGARNQAKNVEVNTRSVFTGVRAAWKTLTRSATTRRTSEQLSASRRKAMQLPRRTTEPKSKPLTSLPEERLSAAESYYLDDSDYEAVYQKSSNTDWQNGADDFEPADTNDF